MNIHNNEITEKNNIIKQLQNELEIKNKKIKILEDMIDLNKKNIVNIKKEFQEESKPVTQDRIMDYLRRIIC